MTGVAFRPYTRADLTECIAIFDANCPAFFAANERQHYLAYLDRHPEGYEVCELDSRLVGAFGLADDGDDRMTLNWIMLHPDTQGTGVGSCIMRRAIKRAESAGASALTIAASHKSQPFFRKFGAETVTETEHGWGPGMHRVDMTISL